MAPLDVVEALSGLSGQRPPLAAQFDVDAGTLVVALRELVREHLAELSSERVEF